VHGDLAARNVLLADGNIVKICDFGLSHVLRGATYTKKSDTPLPVKWLALETLNYGVSSVQSDVWSYGVLLWELFSLGRVPYPDIQPGHQLCRLLEDGHRLDRPERATAEL
jgi:serine/threonine protein kinase